MSPVSHQVLKHEVELMSKMAKTIDGFTQNQTRMAVIIDGLDACEQDKVLQMLDTVCVFYINDDRSFFTTDNKIIWEKELHFSTSVTQANV